MDHVADHIEAIPGRHAALVQWRILRAVAIAALSAVAAFATVRPWRVPLGGAARVPARLAVDTQPPGAELFVDDQPRGTTPQTLSLDPGAHTFVVRAAGIERAVRVTLAPGADVVHHFEFAPNPAGAG